MWYSATKLKKFELCPHAYYRYYLLGEQPKEKEALIFGTRFHEAISRMNEFNREMFQEEHQKMVDALRANTDFQKYEISAFEQKIWARPQHGDREYPFFLILDAVARDKTTGEEVVLEFKSSKTEWDDKKCEDNAIQASVYRHFSSFEKVVYFVVTKHKKPRVQCIVPETFIDKEKIFGICDRIKEEFEYAPITYKTNINSCFFCDYKDTTCPAWF